MYVLFRYRWRVQCVCAVHVSLEVTVCMCFSGIVGDWKTYFTVTQSEQMDDVIAEHFRNSVLKDKAMV